MDSLFSMLAAVLIIALSVCFFFLCRNVAMIKKSLDVLVPQKPEVQVIQKMLPRK